MVPALADRERVFEALEGRACKYCDDGELTSGEHKGAPAVVCDSCEVPQISFS